MFHFEIEMWRDIAQTLPDKLSRSVPLAMNS